MLGSQSCVTLLLKLHVEGITTHLAHTVLIFCVCASVWISCVRSYAVKSIYAVKSYATLTVIYQKLLV